VDRHDRKEDNDWVAEFNYPQQAGAGALLIGCIFYMEPTCLDGYE